MLTEGETHFKGLAIAAVVEGMDRKAVFELISIAFLSACSLGDAPEVCIDVPAGSVAFGLHSQLRGRDGRVCARSEAPAVRVSRLPGEHQLTVVRLERGLDAVLTIGDSHTFFIDDGEPQTIVFRAAHAPSGITVNEQPVVPTVTEGTFSVSLPAVASAVTVSFPQAPDSDGDGWDDPVELSCGTAPHDPTSVPVDRNENGICDTMEKRAIATVASR